MRCHAKRREDAAAKHELFCIFHPVTIFPTILLAGCALAVFTRAASADLPSTQPSDLRITQLTFPDGLTWLLDDHGLGRPFLVRVTLSNPSDHPVKLWPSTSTEGSQCCQIILTASDG